jgi:branched-chain amino acid transport system permease protein
MADAKVVEGPTGGQGFAHARGLGLLAVLVALLLVYPFLFTLPYQIHLPTLIFLFASLAQAWNILAGYCGQISLGNVVFFGVGAYTSTLLMRWLDLSPWLGMVVGGLLAVALAVAIGFPVFRLRGHYFSIATIAIGEIAYQLMLNWPAAGGASGILLPILPDGLVNFQFHRDKWPYYYIALGLLGVVTLASWSVDRSPLGYRFRAIKSDPDAAQSLGIDITRYKLYALMLSAFFTALGGAFYANYVLFIDPDSVLVLSLSVLIALIAVLGGVGTLWGPILGAAVLLPISELTRIQFGGTGGAVDLIVYGALIVLLAVFEPGGIMAMLRSTERLRRRAPGPPQPVAAD